MKRFLIVAVMALLCLSGLAFAGPLPAAGPNEAYVIMQDLALWQDEFGGNLKWIENLTLGDKVQLVGKTGKFKQDGKERDYTRIKALSGKEGWVRSSYLISNCTLAVVKAEKSVIYTEPRDVKVTSRTISNMTIVAVMKDATTGSFMKVTAWDIAQETLNELVWVSVDDLTFNDVDVNAVVLFRVAQGQKSADIKKNLLNLAATKYGASLFIDKITGKPAAPVAAVAKAISPAAGIYIVNDKNVNLRASPDEKAGQVVAVLQANTEVAVIEVTTDSYTVGSQTAQWFHLKDPAGWVFGSFLSPKP